VHALTTGDFKEASKVLMVERASTSLACIVGHDLQAPSKVGIALSSSYSVQRASSLAKVEAFFSLSNLISFNHASHSGHSASSVLGGYRKIQMIPLTREREFLARSNTK
jgi:hypothetical protein